MSYLFEICLFPAASRLRAGQRKSTTIESRKRLSRCMLLICTRSGGVLGPL
jgi:hypothetical protein